ncbi:hypothetical protein ASD78_18950 [Lysobacter sp. Root667]|nr:hypothetical protein ASD78_18950 [Lysobacter sp. Root667]
MAEGAIQRNCSHVMNRWRQMRGVLLEQRDQLIPVRPCYRRTEGTQQHFPDLVWIFKPFYVLQQDRNDGWVKFSTIEQVRHSLHVHAGRTQRFHDGPSRSISFF